MKDFNNHPTGIWIKKCKGIIPVYIEKFNYIEGKDGATEGCTTTVKLTEGTQKGASNIYENEQGNKHRIEGKDIIMNDGLKIERLF